MNWCSLSDSLQWILSGVGIGLVAGFCLALAHSALANARHQE